MILSYEEIDRDEWSRLVRTSATGTWFQTPEAYEFFASMPDLFAPFVVGLEASPQQCSTDGHRQSDRAELFTPKGKGERLRGVCVGYVTVEKNPTKQFFTRRTIIIGGPCLADDAMDEEVEALLEAAKKEASLRLPPKGKRDTAQEPSHLGCFRGRLCSLLLGRDGVGSPIYIETRNFNDYSRWKGSFEKAGFEYQPHLNFHVDCTDKEAMWESLSENRKRQVRHVNGDCKYEIGDRRFGSEGVTEQDVREWYEILAELYRTKVKTPLWPVEFFLEAYRQKVGKFMLVQHEGKIIGGSMVVVWKPTSDSSLKGREETAQVSFAKVWGAHTADSTQYDLLKENAIANRKTPTEAEAILWDLLKGNNIGLHFRRQHIILDYIVDFICLDKGLVIELDGGYHNNPEQKEYDEQRTAHLQRLGYTELRFTNEELLVNPDSVVAKIKEVASKLPSLKGRTEERLGTVYEWFECGMNTQYKDQFPSVMATWAGMQYAQETGCARYDMMGAGVPGVPYGVRDFKSEFGGDMVEHGRFLCVCKPLLYKLGVLGVKILKRK